MIPLHCTTCDQAIRPGEPYQVHDQGNATGYTYTHHSPCKTPPADGTGGPDPQPAQGQGLHLPGPARATTRRGRGLHGHLVHHLGQLIVSGGLDDGPIAPEAISDTFDVSRTVVRESLRALEAKGLISARPNVGTRVRPPTEWNLLDADVITWRSHGPHADDQHRELSELRWMVEATAARLAADHPDEDSRALPLPCILLMDEALRAGRPDDFSRADTEFHRLIVQASGNRMLQHLHATVTATATATTCETAPDTTLRCHPDKTALVHHDVIAQAILNHTADAADAAEQAMRDLLADLIHTGTTGMSPDPAM